MPVHRSEDREEQQMTRSENIMSRWSRMKQESAKAR